MNQSNGGITLFGTPEHGNIGDQLIAEVEVELLRELFPRTQIREVAAKEYIQKGASCLSDIGRKDLIVFHGGGNLGNIWLREEMLRREVLLRFPNNPKVIMPQSIWFTEDDEGYDELMKSQWAYAVLNEGHFSGPRSTESSSGRSPVGECGNRQAANGRIRKSTGDQWAKAELWDPSAFPNSPPSPERRGIHPTRTCS